MTYQITGLAPEPFAELFSLDDAALVQRRARRVVADSDRGYPCRVSLEHARSGETLMLLHHVHNDVETPYRSAFAIYVRENATAAARYRDELPPVLAERVLSLRAFAADGTMLSGQLVQPGKVDAAIRALLDDGATSYIHAHNAAYGCFAARIERTAS